MALNDDEVTSTDKLINVLNQILLKRSQKHSNVADSSIQVNDITTTVDIVNDSYIQTTSETPIQCGVPNCDTDLDGVSDLVEHLWLKHTAPTIYECSHCNDIVVAEKLSNIGTHFQFHGETLYHCPLCMFVTVDPKLILKHFNTEQHMDDAINFNRYTRNGTFTNV